MKLEKEEPKKSSRTHMLSYASNA